MLISDSLRLVFVHVPKTGGDSIDKLLREQIPDHRKQPGGRHPSLGKIVEREPQLASYWSFALVRNPWARMVSWWSMIDKWNRAYGPASGKPQVAQGGMRDGNKMWRQVAEYADFTEFILRGTDEIARLRTPQGAYLRDGDREVDHIGRTETLAADIALVQDHLGLPRLEVPHHNQSGSRGHWRDFYTPDARDRIAQAYAPDIQRWGYSFDD